MLLFDIVWKEGELHQKTKYVWFNNPVHKEANYDKATKHGWWLATTSRIMIIGKLYFLLIYVLKLEREQRRKKLIYFVLIY